MYLGWIPNAISLMRIALIAPILMLILRDQYGWALGLFFFAGFSDGLDGYLATRFSWQTRLGGLLDPVADKLLVAGMFITLAWVQQIPAWLAIVVILRDVVIFGGAVAYNFLIEPVEGEPSRISKDRARGFDTGHRGDQRRGLCMVVVSPRARRRNE
jgi:cardiolipin synthase